MAGPVQILQGQSIVAGNGVHNHSKSTESTILLRQMKDQKPLNYSEALDLSKM